MALTRIKICGITTPADARVAISAGADAIGLVFYPDSPRAVTAKQAQQIASVVPPFVSVVALFVDESAENIQTVLASVSIDVLQFHGDEPATFCQQFGRPWIKAVRVKAGVDIVQACDNYVGARGILLDSWQEGVPGGTGQRFDWSLASGDMSLPVVLAGGLNAGNVGAAVAQLRPAAVDVSGGVEREPGIKDVEKIRHFIAAVRAADQLADGAEHDD